MALSVRSTGRWGEGGEAGKSDVSRHAGRVSGIYSDGRDVAPGQLVLAAHGAEVCGSRAYVC